MSDGSESRWSLKSFKNFLLFAVTQVPEAPFKITRAIDTSVPEFAGLLAWLNGELVSFSACLPAKPRAKDFHPIRPEAATRSGLEMFLTRDPG